MGEIDWLRFTALLMVAVLVFPAVLRRRRGRLRDAAIWLAVLTALVLLYQTFGPI